MSNLGLLEITEWEPRVLTDMGAIRWGTRGKCQ